MALSASRSLRAASTSRSAARVQVRRASPLASLLASQPAPPRPPTPCAPSPPVGAQCAGWTTAHPPAHRATPSPSLQRTRRPRPAPPSSAAAGSQSWRVQRWVGRLAGCIVVHAVMAHAFRLTGNSPPPSLPPTLQDKEKVLADVRAIISQQLGADLDKVGESWQDDVAGRMLLSAPPSRPAHTAPPTATAAAGHRRVQVRGPGRRLPGHGEQAAATPIFACPPILAPHSPQPLLPMLLLRRWRS